MEEEYISLNEYARRYKMGTQQVKYMCEQGQLEYRRTEKGYYKIKVGGNTVSNEAYESVIRENAELRAIIKTIQNIINPIKI